MTDEELLKFMEDIESDRIERKESISDGDKIRQAICAFANDTNLSILLLSCVLIVFLCLADIAWETV